MDERYESKNGQDQILRNRVRLHFLLLLQAIADHRGLNRGIVVAERKFRNGRNDGLDSGYKTLDEVIVRQFGFRDVSAQPADGGQRSTMSVSRTACDILMGMGFRHS